MNGLNELSPSPKEQWAARNKIILALLEQGKNYMEIAAQFHISRERVRQIAAKAGMAQKIIKARQALKRKMGLEIVSMFQKGMPPMDIARRLSLKYGKVYRILKLHGYFGYKRMRKQNKEHALQAVRLFESRKSVKEIAQALGISPGYARDVLRRAGKWENRRWQAERARNKQILQEIQNPELTYAAIGEKYGLTYASIQHIAFLVGIHRGGNMKEYAERRQNMKEDAKQGLTIGQLARKYGLSEGRIYAILHVPGEGRKLMMQKYQRLRELYEEGKRSSTQIAHELGYSRSYVLLLLRRFYPGRQSSKVDTERKQAAARKHELFKKLYEEGKLNRAQIARELGYNVHHVRHLLNRYYPERDRKSPIRTL